MDIRPYEYLLAVADTGSLSAAARQLQISQSALSHFLTKWENELGQPLFYRSTRRLWPTAAGELYIHTAKQIVSIKKQSLQAIQKLRSPYDRELLLGISPHSGAEIYTYLYKEFSTRHPNLLLSTREAYMHELKSMLLRKELDFLIGTASDFHQADYRFLCFGRQEILLAISNDHPLSSYASSPLDGISRSIRLREVEDIPFVRSSPGNTLRELTDHLFAEAQIAPTIVFESANSSLLCELIASNQGIGLLPANYLYARKGLKFFSPSPRAWMYVGIFYNHGRHLDSDERHLICLCYQQSIRLRKNPHFIPEPDPAVQDMLREFGYH